MLFTIRAFYFSVVALFIFIPVPALSEVPCRSEVRGAGGGPITDGGTIRLGAHQVIGEAPVLQGAHYILSGYRYNRSPPTRTLPNGELKERIHRSCHRIGPPLEGDPSGYELKLDRNLPSGDYFLGVVSRCPDDLEQEVCEDTHNFLVTPSYITTTLDTLNIRANSEDPEDSPSEMKFQFASFSGKPFISGQALTAKVTLSGNYPAGPHGSSHVTPGDGATLKPKIPIFVGRQSVMFSEECLEEASSLPNPIAELSAERCNLDETQGRFSDHFEMAVTGVELDSDNAAVWGKVAGVAAGGLSCYLAIKSGGTTTGVGDCLSDSTTLAVSIGGAVEKALSDDDDNLGKVGLGFQLQPNLTWRSSGTQGFGPHDFIREGEDKISAIFRNRVSGGLRLLNYQVELEEIEVLEGYEVYSRCREPQEIYAIARSNAFLGRSYPSSKKFPEDSDFFSVPINLGVKPIINRNTFDISNAPESPALYVEVGIWESDGEDRDGDLVGLVSATHHWEDLFTRSHPSHREAKEIVHIDGHTPEGLPIRELRASFSLEGKGFVGSDFHCADIFNNQRDRAIFTQRDPNGNQGHVRVTYRITATWLRNVTR